MRTVRLASVLATTALLVAAAAGRTDAAPRTDPVPPAGTSATVTLPLFGAPLTVDLTTGPGGVLESVSITPSDGFTQSLDKPHLVVFTNDDGTAKVAVGSLRGGQAVVARAGSLADVSGDGSWESDVFGTGTITHVTFTIGATPEGGPDVRNVATDDPTATIAPTKYFSIGGPNGPGQAALAVVVFTHEGKARFLNIGVHVATKDGTAIAGTALTLSQLKDVGPRPKPEPNPNPNPDPGPGPQPGPGPSLPPGTDAGGVGEHDWNGTLCNGTPASMHYTIHADGTVTLGAVSPAPMATLVFPNKVGAKFSYFEMVGVAALLTDSGVVARLYVIKHCPA